MFFFLKMTLHIQVVVKAYCYDFHPNVIRDNFIPIQKNEILLTDFRQV